jgi:glycosyltransferase involved in cell wall biosynthesis
VRACLVYDRLYPLTLGGAERWMTELAQRLAAGGHEVTYLTQRHWDRSVQPDVPGVRVVAVGPRMEAYDETRRTILPPLVFGACALWHFLRHRRAYDVVHTASFPYFSVLAAAAARRLGGYRIVVDWHEVWTLDYWREYLGRVGGRIGWLVQRACVAVPHRAFCFSRLHARRLRAEGLRGEVEVLTGEYSGSLDPPGPVTAEPLVVFAGRHIPEKRVPALVRAMALVRERRPELRCEIYGDGPERGEVLRLVRELGLQDTVSVSGFVAHEQVEDALARAACMVLPSSREGYGLVVVEAAARGTPSVVVAGPDNAAVELVDDGENGFVAPSAAPSDLAEAIVRAADAGPALRAATAAWFACNAERLSLETSLKAVLARYAAAED